MRREPCPLQQLLTLLSDVLTNARTQPLGVRAFCDDPQEVSAYGISMMKGYKNNVLTMGKHFPSYGNLEFLGSALDVPTITESLEQLSLSALVPFRNAIREGIDSIMVGGCAMASAGLDVMHACLSERVVDQLLRKDLEFDGCVVSECLEMESLCSTIGIGSGTIMAVEAGCDIILLCRSFTAQKEAITGLKLGLDDSVVTRERINDSLRRVLTMKSKCAICTWEHALNPPGVSSLMKLQPIHTRLSTKAYNESITVVRDRNHLLPLTNILEPSDELLLLTPLVKPWAAASTTQGNGMPASVESPQHVSARSASVMTGERVFRELGRTLARQRSGRVLHTSYTASGVRPVHESLVDRAAAVIVVTADATRNLYQSGFTKHIAMICKTNGLGGGDRREKPLIVVSVSSPYDFALEGPSVIPTYICTYDFTETCMNSLVSVLYGELNATGRLPGSISQNPKLQQAKQHWLVEAFNEERDAEGLDNLIQAIVDDSPPDVRSELAGATSGSFLLGNSDVLEAHFVVRNSTTRALYGFCATYFYKSTGAGVIGGLIVDPSRRQLSIGHSLHSRAIRTLLQRPGIKLFQLGSRIPSVYLGVPAGNSLGNRRLRPWFATLGWNVALSRPICSMIARNLVTWSPPDGMARSLQSSTAEYDLIYGWEYSGPILDHIKTNSRPGLVEVYKLALGDPSACGIIRAKRSSDGGIIGTLILYNARSKLAEFVPAMKDKRELLGGISSPIISNSVGEFSTVLQSLLLLGMRQIKQQGCTACLLDYVSIVEVQARRGFADSCRRWTGMGAPTHP